MDVDSIARDAKNGHFPPVCVLVGGESFLIERALSALRKTIVGESGAGFNEDLFHGKSTSGDVVVRSANTLPMFASARLVVVRDVEAVASADLDVVAAYAESPSPSTCLVLLGEKLDGRTRLAKLAKQKGFLCDVQPLKGDGLRRFVASEASARGHRIDGRAAEALLDATGSDLSTIDDALERLSLFVGAGAAIGIADVEACVARVRVDTIWMLVDAVGEGDARRALLASGSLLADREPPLRILAMVARQFRMIAKMRDALASGLRPADAAKEAGAPPFKADELARSAKRFPPAMSERAFRLLSDADSSLKGSKTPPDVVLQRTLLALCER